MDNFIIVADMDIATQSKDEEALGEKFGLSFLSRLQ
jgi:hypothetical protein